MFSDAEIVIYRNSFGFDVEPEIIANYRNSENDAEAHITAFEIVSEWASVRGYSLDNLEWVLNLW